MNRLILIGNGFDLAHGMPTSYIDFIKWYLKKCFYLHLKREKNSRLINIAYNPNYEQPYPTKTDIDTWVEGLNGSDFKLQNFGKGRYGDKGYTYPFIFYINSEFFKALLDHCAVKRWVDVEAIFYDQLISILELPRTKGRKNYDFMDEKESRLNVLHKDLHIIISNLEEYLLTVPNPPYINAYERIFLEPIKIDDLDSKTKKEYTEQGYCDQPPKAVHVLNFNYTDTAEQYINRLSMTPSVSINNIHGKLEDNDNPMVFGFGDELDERYLQMEREKSNGYYEHIKSFAYFKTSRYTELVRFTEMDEYQVLVLGHSCGLSDRTMLNMILEHKNCKSIKIYYHNKETGNNYTDTTYEIARHFKDKVVMRDRIVKLDKSEEMPQVDRKA
ncbi:MAG TPA: AbiH family protein [Mucilaginibacter sp.]|jgi:hypothetical protein|nr:AbiH family protein [Mucilaginibacter sp.]